MYEIDKIDRQIVEQLMEDGRKPAAVIAREVGEITERIVRYRIDRMIAEGLLQIRPIVAPKLLGLTTVADIFLEIEADSVQEVARKVAAYDNVSYVACAIGDTDISIQVVAKDAAEVYQFVTEVIGKIPGVRKTTTSIVPVIVKDIHQWHIPSRLVKTDEGNS